MVDYSTLHDFLSYFAIISSLLLILVLVVVVPEIVRLVRPVVARFLNKPSSPTAPGGRSFAGASVEVSLSGADRQVLEGLNAKLTVLSLEVSRLRQVVGMAAGRGGALRGGAPEESGNADSTKDESAHEPALSFEQPLGSDLLDLICATYNPGVGDKSARELFRARFCPVRIGVANAGERVRNPKVLPVFEINEGGNYFAVPIEASRYAVVPRYGLTFQEAHYSSGAMGDVFLCPKYRQSRRYLAVSVVKPAVFELEPGKGWTIKQTGELDLGQGVS